MQETPVPFGKIPWRRDRLPTLVFLGFPSGLDGTESVGNAGDLGSMSGLGISPRGRHGNPLQYSCLENFHGQRSLEGYSPWGHKQVDTAEAIKHSRAQGEREFTVFNIMLSSGILCNIQPSKS